MTMRDYVDCLTEEQKARLAKLMRREWERFQKIRGDDDDDA